MIASQTDLPFVRNLIGGKWEIAKSESSEYVFNPSTGEPIALVPLSDTSLVDKAVMIAAAAQSKWSQTR